MSNSRSKNKFYNWFPSPLKSFRDYDWFTDDDKSPTEDSRWRTDENMVGGYLAVIPFLSNNGKTSSLVRSNGEAVNIDVVRGKHLLICCVSLPMPKVGDDGHSFRAMIAAHSELSRDDFEMVIVAKMRRNYANDKSVFDHFFSAFPCCLTIPFSESETRNYIYSFIGFDRHRSYPVISGIVVDPTGKILRYLDTSRNFLTYGSEWFPFLDSNLKAIKNRDEVFKIRLDPFYNKYLAHVSEVVKQDPLLRVPLSLHKDILLRDPSFVLTRNGSVSGAHQQSLTVSELSNKYVGVYLCVDGVFIEKLNQVHKHCTANNQELEIVVICVPRSNDPKSFQEVLIKALEHCNVTSWFIFPYKDKICRRLFRVFGNLIYWPDDKFIILPPNCKSGELEGKTVIKKLGIDEYPFTKSTVLQRRFITLRSLSLASLFNIKGSRKTRRTCLVRNKRNGRMTKVRRNELEGKKLLLYIGWCSSVNGWYQNPMYVGELSHLLIKHYSKIRRKGWEVVFIPRDSEDVKPPYRKEVAEMPWPIMTVSDAIKHKVIDKLFLEGEEVYDKQLIAVGEDGRILAREIEDRLVRNGLTDSLFNDNLYQEISDHLEILDDSDYD